MKDWTGNKATHCATIGASNLCNHDREKFDYYATDQKAAELLIENEPLSDTIWECACGDGHLGKVFEEHGKNVIATDLIFRGYGQNEPFDFLTHEPIDFDGDIVTNPPYKYALEFVKRSLEIVKDCRKVCMFLKLTFLEGKKRKVFFQSAPPRTVYVISGRLGCAMNGNFKAASQRAIAYAWYVWEKGFCGDPVIKWIG